MISKEKNFITKSNKKQKKTKGEGSQNKVPKKDKKRDARTFFIKIEKARRGRRRAKAAAHSGRHFSTKNTKKIHSENSMK